MSRLEYLARPLIAFDPGNRSHRRYYWEFLEYKGWGQCPVRFICTEEHGDNLPSMIQRIMIEYYVNKEFKPKAQSQLGSIVSKLKLVVQKVPKTVDKATKR